MGDFGYTGCGGAGGGAAIGGLVTGGTENSVLFVGAAGVLAQDNANFSRTAAQFKFATTTEALTGGAMRLEFLGINGGPTEGLHIRSTGGTSYYPFHITLSNAAYATQSQIGVGPTNGMDFVCPSPATWTFVAWLSGAAKTVRIKSTTAAVSDTGVLEVDAGYAAQAGVRIKLAATPTADAIQVMASDGTTKLWNVGATGFMETIEITAPSAPSSNGVRIYAEDNGSGKTRLMALFSSGAAQQIAIQP